jgi:hypothetical protein
VLDFDGPEIGERATYSLKIIDAITAVYEPFQTLPKPLALGAC